METAPEPLDDMQRIQKLHFTEMARSRLMTIGLNSDDPVSILYLHALTIRCYITFLFLAGWTETAFWVSSRQVCNWYDYAT